MARRAMLVLTTALLALGLSPAIRPQEPARGRGAGASRVTRPPLFFREEWKQTPAGGEHPVVVSEALSNPNLELKLYGPTGKEILMTGSAQDENNPIHLWTGMCTTPCAVALREKNNYADLTGLARIRWVTKVSGFHQVRPIIKLGDGTWLVGDHTDGSTVDWLQSDFSLADARWLRLDINAVVTKGNIADTPDLSKVDEIGFVDLVPGSGHGPGGWIDVATIEVFGTSIKR
jgi:hypothetical protein